MLTYSWLKPIEKLCFWVEAWLQQPAMWQSELYSIRTCISTCVLRQEGSNSSHIVKHNWAFELMNECSGYLCSQFCTTCDLVVTKNERPVNSPSYHRTWNNSVCHGGLHKPVTVTLEKCCRYSTSQTYQQKSARTDSKTLWKVDLRGNTTFPYLPTKQQNLLRGTTHLKVWQYQCCDA